MNIPSSRAYLFISTKPPCRMKLRSLKLTCSPLKMDGWNTIVSFWSKFGLFSELLLLVSGRVPGVSLEFSAKLQFDTKLLMAKTFLNSKLPTTRAFFVVQVVVMTLSVHFFSSMRSYPKTNFANLFGIVYASCASVQILFKQSDLHIRIHTQQLANIRIYTLSFHLLNLSSPTPHLFSLPKHLRLRGKIHHSLVVEPPISKKCSSNYLSPRIGVKVPKYI